MDVAGDPTQPADPTEPADPTGPAQAPRSLTVSLGTGLDGPGRARSALRRQLDSRGHEPVLDDVLLLASEVVTNAVLHGSPDVELTVSDSGDEVRVEVVDASPVEPVLHPFTDERHWGRGMALVNALACRWGVDPAPNGGKRVWFVVGPDRATGDRAG